LVGYYVHHHGEGHLRRAEAIAAHLHSRLTVLSSLPAPPGWSTPWVQLPPDDRGEPVDVTAAGTLHWAPRHDDGLAARAAVVTGWIAEHRPVLLVVDVSVEVALLARLTGTPVVVMAMPGDRGDRPHVLAYDLAERLLAAWPEEARDPSWPARWHSKTLHVGAVSRFDGRPRPPRTTEGGDRPRALLLWGSGGGHRPDVDALRGATPGWEWTFALPGADWLHPDALWEALCTYDVVLAHAGQSSVAEVAAARAPAVVVADPRPFDEQHHTVARLREAGIATALDAWPESTRLPDLLTRASAAGGDAWARWSTGEGAARAARAVDQLARELTTAGGSR
jgi:hypothetical protein